MAARAGELARPLPVESARSHPKTRVPMKHARFVLPLALLLLTLAACDSTPPAQAASTPQSSSAPPASAPPASAYDRVAARAQGFATGNLMAARVVYVLFDAQCPHCGRLWQEAKPLLGQVRFVWVPVRLLADVSAKQGAAILASKDPVAEMEAHEASLEAKKGGLIPPADIPAAAAAKVAANTKLMQELSVASVPYVVYKHPVTGQSLSFEGAMTTADLKKTFGL
jgi:thiol:disulfide interchange protein DsbG